MASLSIPQVQGDRDMIGWKVSCRYGVRGTPLDSAGSFESGDIGEITEVLRPTNATAVAVLKTTAGVRFGLLLRDVVRVSIY